MRTTLTLDDDAARQLRQAARTSRRSFKQLVNDALRRGLSGGERTQPNRGRFVVQPKACWFRSGIDLLKLNQLMDELETSDFVAEHSSQRQSS